MKLTIARAVGSALALGALGVAGKVAAQGSATGGPAYIAANCANCHGTSGRSSGAMPSLAGQSKVYLVEQMRAFRDGKRTATIMHQIAKGYTEAQIDAVADHFSRLTK